MRPTRRTFILALLAGAHATAQSQSTFAPPPATKSAVGQWDVGIVKRAEEILASPAQWNRVDSSNCRAAATTFSISCALEKAIEEGAGLYRGQPKPVPTNQPAPPQRCAFHPIATGSEGTCGLLFDELPVFVVSPVKAVTTGRWRTDIEPTAVWAGTMADAEGPVNDEAQRLVDSIATRKYRGSVAGYNNDSTTTFADVQSFFRLLEGRVRARGSADLETSFDSVEIEAYRDGSGVMRTYNGWFAISGFSAQGATVKFQIDTAQQIPPSALDLAILQRAASIITSDAVWNRADNRKCPPAATTWSIYCADEKAMIELAGGFSHRRPAMELVRQIVDERTRKKKYQHRLMGYNNDTTTTLADVRSLFAEAIARIK